MTDEFNQNVVIVSVDQNFIQKLTGLLEGSRRHVLLAHDHSTLADIFLTGVPGLIILDMGQDAEKNLALIAMIRAQSDTRAAEVPLIIVSESGDPIEISSALKFGVKAYFVKSNFDPTLILSHVSKFIQAPPTVAGAADDITIAGIVTPSRPSDAMPTKILIVEDDKFLRDLAVQKISREGFIVIAAVDGEQGILLAEKELPDIILLDILLPGIDGFEVLRRLRANPAFSSTRISMLSNFGQREDIEKALAAGADKFMVKANYTLDEIVGEVKKMTSTQRA